MTATIDVSDLTSIVTFGAKAAEDISKASDTILRSMKPSQVEESNELMLTLTKIMSRFSPEELRENNSLLGKLFGGGKKQLDKIVEKYHNMGDEVDKIYVQLRRYETEIQQDNKQLEALFAANVGYFHELEKYVVAGEQGCQEIADYKKELEEQQRTSGDPAIAFELQTITQALNMLEQRTNDLKTAELVALQSIPMIQMMAYNNMNLVRKINAAFIVTLPVFKQALAQAIMLKRQRLQAQALSALDARTNELIRQNARNTVDQAKLTAQLQHAGTAPTVDALEDSWKTIMSGIQETKTLQEQSAAQRKEGQEKLEAIRRQYAQKL